MGRSFYIILLTRNTIIPTFIPSLITILSNTPTNDPIPAFILCFISLCANISSKSVAPITGPRNIPIRLPTINPTIPPSIAPIIPHVVPPSCLAPSAITTLSINDEIRDMRKITTREITVISSNPLFIPAIRLARNMSHTPGRDITVITNPPSANIAQRIYITISNIHYYLTLN